MAQVYTEFGEAIHLKHLDRNSIAYVPDDDRSEEGQMRLAEKRKADFPKNGFKGVS